MDEDKKDLFDLKISNAQVNKQTNKRKQSKNKIKCKNHY